MERRIRDDWALVALAVSTCLFAAALAALILQPAASTLVGSSDQAWEQMAH